MLAIILLWLPGVCAYALRRVGVFETRGLCSPPGSSVHGILQTGILEWFAISFSRGFYPPRDRSRVSCIAGRFFIPGLLWEPPAS